MKRSVGGDKIEFGTSLENQQIDCRLIRTLLKFRGFGRTTLEYLEGLIKKDELSPVASVSFGFTFFIKEPEEKDI